MADVVVTRRTNRVTVTVGVVPTGTGSVSSVFGRTGAVVGVLGDYSGIYQPIDAGLTSLMAADTTADTVLYVTGANAWAATAFTSFGRSLVDDANAAAARSTIGLVIGTDVLAYDSGLASIASGDTTVDTMGYVTGANTWAYTGLTSFARSILDDADAAAVRTTIDAQQLDADLTALAALSSTGMAARTASGTWAARTLTAGSGVTVTNGDGVAGNPTIALDEVAYILGADQTGIGAETAITGLEFTPAANGIYLIRVIGAFASTASTIGCEHRIDPGNGTGGVVLASRGASATAGVIYYGQMDSTRVLGTSAETSPAATAITAQAVLAATASPTAVRFYARAEAGGGGNTITIKAGTIMLVRRVV